MNARFLARGIRFICRRGQESCRLRLFYPPGMCLSQWLLTAHSLSRLPPQHRCLRASLFTVTLRSTVNSARCGLRVERLPPPSPLSLSPTPLLRHGVGPLSLRLRQQTLFAFPFPLPHRHLRFSPVSIRFNSNAPRNLRLLFRAVNAGMLRFLLQSHGSHTDRHILPTHKRKKPTTFHAHGSSLLSVCDAGPNPRPMCGAPPDCFAPAMSATASLTPSLTFTSASRPASSPHIAIVQPLDLICLSASRESGVLSHHRQSRFTP